LKPEVNRQKRVMWANQAAARRSGVSRISHSPATWFIIGASSGFGRLLTMRHPMPEAGPSGCLEGLTGRARRGSLATQIPEPRQAALQVAFGLTAGPPPERFAVAMAALDLLDTATVDVLRFLARRLGHDPIVLLATARDAWEYLSRLHNEADPAHHPFQALWSLSHLAYAAGQCDRVEETRKMVARLRCLLPAPDELIEVQVRAALDTEVGNWPFERSRMQFLLGARLRRQKQIQEAREPPRAALNGFENLGTSLWAERAREELRAAGVAIRAQAPAPWSSLSAQQLQVARMAAEGLSNRQIAERLYLSQRTVMSLDLPLPLPVKGAVSLPIPCLRPGG
jgi:Bacterial regulatory proteins, luxR family